MDAHIYWSWSEFIVRHGPVPPAPFFLAPLYPYFLAALRLLGAGSAGSVLVVQAALGAAAVALLSDATARVGGRFAGITIGALLALGQATTFFDALILPESFLFFLESVLVWFVVRTDWRTARPRTFAMYGFLAGVLTMGRASHGVILVLVVLLARAALPEWKAGLRAVLAAATAWAACLLPSAIANSIASSEVIPLTYSLGFNFAVGFNPEADGSYVDITAGSLPVPLEATSPTTGAALDGRAYLLATQGERFGASESSRAWRIRAADFIREHPMRAAELAVRKIGLTWNHRALPQIESIASMERAAGPLGLPFLGSFGFIALPGLAGLLWAVRGSTAERWLAGYALLMTLALIPFFITDRYRHHLVPALAVLSGIAVRAGWHVIRSGRRDARLRAAIAAACASVVVFFPIAARDERLGSWAAEADASIRLAEAGRDAEAVAAFERAEQALHRARLEELSTSARTAVASFHLHYGIALASLGREDDAITHWEEAARISPNDATSLARLQIAYRRSGRSVDEARVTRELDAVPGGRGLVLLNEGWWAAGRGDLAGAEQAFLEASRVSTDLTMAWEGLIRVLIQEGRFDDADRALAAARDAGLDGFPANVYASYLAARRGDIATAQRTIARIPVRLPQADPTLRRLLEDARRLVSSTPTRPARGGS